MDRVWMHLAQHWTRHLSLPLYVVSVKRDHLLSISFPQILIKGDYWKYLLEVVLHAHLKRLIISNTHKKKKD